MPTNYVVKISGAGSGTFDIMDKEARELIASDEEAIAELDEKVSKTAYLDNNEDLNSVLAQGNYRGDAGSYTYGHLPAGVDSIFLLQVFDGDGNYRIQILTEYADNNYAVYTRFRYGESPTWSAWTNGTDSFSRPLPTGTDLDQVMSHGSYRGDAGTSTYSHIPSGIDSIFLLQTFNGGGNYRIQILTQYADDKYAVYTRFRYGSTPVWSAWVKGFAKEDFVALQNTVSSTTYINDGTDLDTVLDQGNYRGDAGYWSYTHIPDGITSIFLLQVYNGGGNYRIQILTQYVDDKYIIYTRYRFGATPVWSNWSKGFDGEVFNDIVGKTVSGYDSADFDSNSQVIKDTSNVFTGTTPNVGLKLRIMNYNVAHYTNDTQYSTLVFLPDEKRHNFKKMLSEIQPDFMCMEEDSSYIDGAENVSGSLNTKPALDYLYKPVFPYAYGTDETFIRSKYAATDGGDTLQYQNSGRWLRYAVFTVGDNKKLLLVSTHPTPQYPGYDISTIVAIRQAEFTQLFKWVYQEITLQSYATSEAVTCPAWDYCIICGDMNCSTDTDKSNLTTLAEARGFTMANGGWMNWMETCHDGQSANAIDDIMCSDNIIINGIVSYQSMYKSLYSDHYPFVADVVLL